MNCIFSVTYSYELNREPVGIFRSSRGIRQRDPLSPFLFLFCAEGLSYLLHCKLQRDTISGLKVSKSGPTISHLLFVDDFLIFYQCSLIEINHLQYILRTYELMLG